MNYQIKLKEYSGPLSKLLELVEERKLEITQINLAEVTADFLKYVKSLTQADKERTKTEIPTASVADPSKSALVSISPSELADFLVVAGKLVLIKSKALLPMLELTKEEEEDIHDLETRLKIYREFKEASEHIGKLWSKNRVAYGREFLASLGEKSVFYPSKDLKISDLAGAIRNLAAALQVLVPDTQKIKRAVFTIEQKVEELLNRVKAAGRHGFSSLTAKKSKEEAVVLFLAVLHLLKDKVISVDQEKEFGEIHIERATRN